MSIVKVTELTETSGLTSNSLFLVSYGEGSPKESKYITADNLKNYVDKEISFVTDGNTGVSNVENIRIVNGPAIDTSFAPHTATFDFIDFITLDRPRNGGNFFSTQTQTSNGTAKAMSFTDNDISLACTLSSSTEIFVYSAGIYNLQFSAQINKTQGGTAEDVYIWFRVSGQDVPNSNTKLTLANNNQFTVASWNIMLNLEANSTIQIMWASSDEHIELVYVSDANTPFGPAIPSVIATLTQV